MKRKHLCLFRRIVAALALSVPLGAVAQTHYVVKIDPEDKSFGALRYMDAVYFDLPKVVMTGEGHDVPAVAVNLENVNPALILLLNYWGEPVITEDMVLYLEYAWAGTQVQPGLEVEVMIQNEQSGAAHGGGSPGGRYAVETDTKDEAWFCAEVDLVQLGAQAGETLSRIFLYPSTEGAAGQFLVRKVAVCPKGTFVGSGTSQPAVRDLEEKRKEGPKYLAVHPKSLWYTDDHAFFSEKAVQEVSEHGYNILGCPVHPPSVSPEKWQADYAMYRETGRRMAAFGGMKLNVMMPMCASVPADFPYLKLVEASGAERMVPCPADEKYWQERIIPCLLGYAELSREVPTFGVIVDWEIYESVGNSYSLCYCDGCWEAFAKRADARPPEALARDKRHGWIWDNDLEGLYRQTFSGRVAALTKSLRESVDAINPRLSFWTLPGVFVGNPFWEPFVRQIASVAAPVIVSDEYTYGKPRDAKSDEEGIEANVRTCLEDQRKLTALGIPYLYLAATYNDWGSPDYHGRAAERMARVSDGLWFFEDMGPYEEGTGLRREEMWRAYQEANAKIRSETRSHSDDETVLH